MLFENFVCLAGAMMLMVYYKEELATGVKMIEPMYNMAGLGFLKPLET